MNHAQSPVIPIVSFAIPAKAEIYSPSLSRGDGEGPGVRRSLPAARSVQSRGDVERAFLAVGDEAGRRSFDPTHVSALGVVHRDGGRMSRGT